MGYDLHITRKEFWADEAGPGISFEEWTGHVKVDTDLEKDPLNGTHDFLYAKHPKEPAPLWWNDGEIYTKNPDADMVRKLIEIAQQLGAKVQGDNGEQYSDWSRFPLPDPVPVEPKKMGFFQRLFRK